ncbi:MAG: hypothetical protein ACRC46_06390 [Thermoguttaceae bacterium]
MRSTMFVCCAVVLCGVLRGAETPPPQVPSPAIVSLVAEASKTVEAMENPVARAEGLLELIDLQLTLAPETPADDATLKSHREAFDKIVSTIDDSATRMSLLDAAVNVALRLKDYNTVFALTEKFDEPYRNRGTIVILGKILAEDGGKTVDLVPRFEKVMSEVVTQPALTSLASVLLGKAYALKGDKTAAAAAFAKAIETAATLEALEEQNILGLIISLEVTSGMIDDAKAFVAAHKQPAQQQYFYGMLALTMIELPAAERDAEFAACLAAITDDNIRTVAISTLIQRLVSENVACDALATWIDNAKTPEAKIAIATAAADALLDVKRFADAATLATMTTDTDLADSIRLMEIDSLVRTMKWDLAVAKSGELAVHERRGQALAGLLVAARRHADAAVFAKVSAMLDSPVAQTRKKELRDSFAVLAKANDPQSVMARIDELGVLFGQQFVLGDIDGGIATLNQILASLPLCTDVDKRFEVLVQTLSMLVKLQPRTEVLAYYNGAVKQIIDLQGIDNNQRLAGLLYLASAASDCLDPKDMTLPLDAVIAFVKTIEDPTERTAATLALARQWADMRR